MDVETSGIHPKFVDAVVFQLFSSRGAANHLESVDEALIVHT